MSIQRISLALDGNPYPDDNGRLCYFKSHEAILFEKQHLINALDRRVEDLENEIRKLRVTSSCTCNHQ